MTNETGSPAATVAFVLDRDQARGILRDLQRSINKGAKTVLLICGPPVIDAPEGDVTEHGLGNVPIPELFLVNNVFTAAFANEPEATLRALGVTIVEGD